MNTVDLVYDAYLARWGEPSRRADFDNGSRPQIAILKWDAASNGLGVVLYATLGASAEDMPQANPGHRVEYFVGLRPGRDDVGSPLAALGLFASSENELVDHGHTVASDRPLWPGANMSSFLVLRQTGEILPALELPGGVHVEFLQAIPIFESERRFKVAHGAEALMRRWEGAETPFWDPDRRSEPAL
ncbi:suppressor of fused domain protein [Agromyces marinus]|uniref:Suppressor of fused-like domain-containing protein n=1 Tax=Agromyces marinus TaxID=1389020 RepID=A0ABM8GX25_9MICO|nr:hypothetical protein GCM10025870_01280 [Agromyces marinus]